MKLEFSNQNSKYSLQGYTKGTISINNKKYHNTILLNDNNFYTVEKIKDANDISTQFINEIIEKHHPKIIIIGTGTSTTPPKKTLITLCNNQNIGIEWMLSSSCIRSLPIILSNNSPFCMIITP